MRHDDAPEFADPTLRARLEAFARGRGDEELLPWVERLSPLDQRRLREDLAVVLSEPETTGEPLDWREIGNILQEWAEIAGWEDVTLRAGALAPDGAFTVDLRPQDRQALERASPAVQRATAHLLAEFLPYYPTVGFLLPRGRLKKMRDRDLWQLHLPDGYRLRYLVDKVARTVHVVYLGPHPDHDPRGREQNLRAKVKRTPPDEP